METQTFSTEANLSAARGTEWRDYGVGTNGGATATKAASSGARHKICWATFWSDTDTLITLKSGSTTIWEGKLDIDVVGLMIHILFPEPIIGTISEAVTANVASSTSDCGVAFGGFSTLSV